MFDYGIVYGVGWVGWDRIGYESDTGLQGSIYIPIIWMNSNLSRIVF